MTTRPAQRANFDIAIERQRGWRGGIIPVHRAFARIHITAGQVLGNIALAIACSAIWIWSLPLVARWWARVFEFWTHAFHWRAAVVMVPQKFSSWVRFSVPYVTIPGGAPGSAYWIMTAVTFVMLAASFLLPDEALPWAYLLRAVAILQFTAIAYFAVAAARFPHDVSGYTVSMLVFSIIFIGLVPLILGFTYYVFSFSWGQKLGLTLITMGYLAVFVPLQYMLHVWALHLSIVFMPVLYFVFGPFLDVLIFISLYSWGMSWDQPGKTPGVSALRPQR